MKRTESLTKILSVLMLVLVLFSCENEMDKHYQTPDWLTGSAWEVLESRGNYLIFLEGAELAGFKPILEGKSLVTVMAPDDNAFVITSYSIHYTKLYESRFSKDLSYSCEPEHWHSPHSDYHNQVPIRVITSYSIHYTKLYDPVYSGSPGVAGCGKTCQFKC